MKNLRVFCEVELSIIVVVSRAMKRKLNGCRFSSNLSIFQDRDLLGFNSNCAEQ